VAASAGVSLQLLYSRLKAGWDARSAALTSPNPQRSAAQKARWAR
jgi:hypothetical protein